MKKLTFVTAFLMLAQLAFAGGLLTNTNQSAQFIRMMSRNASTGIDAVYFNPAGLIKMEDGFHFAVYNQTIFQTKPVDTEFPLIPLDDRSYEGVVNVPVFPTAFAVYKKENWAFSLGFGPNAGGGSADYDRGLPTFEIPITKVVPALSPLVQLNPAMNVTGYSADIGFEGRSIFWGIQLGATYQVNDIFSVYGGVRYLPSKTTYQGYIKNIQLEMNNENYEVASTWLTSTAGTLSESATTLGGIADNLQSFVDAGAGVYTLTQLQTMGMLDAGTKAELEGGLMVLGYGAEEVAEMNLSTIQENYSDKATELNTFSTKLAGTAGMLGDKKVDTEQTGNAFTPMVGLNISPVENLNIGLKYEMKTALTLENNPNEGDNYSQALFGDKVGSDIPAILSAGAGYSTDRIEAQLSYTMYFNKGVNWGNNLRDEVSWSGVDSDQIRPREIERNGMELALGLQFNVVDNFALSVGGMYGDMGIADSYQSDFSYSNPSTTAGAGFEWNITDALTLDAGFSNTFYQDQTVTFADPDVGTYDEHLKKTTMNFAVGLSYSIF